MIWSVLFWWRSSPTTAQALTSRCAPPANFCSTGQRYLFQCPRTTSIGDEGTVVFLAGQACGRFLGDEDLGFPQRPCLRMWCIQGPKRSWGGWGGPATICSVQDASSTIEASYLASFEALWWSHQGWAILTAELVLQGAIRTLFCHPMSHVKRSRRLPCVCSDGGHGGGRDPDLLAINPQY